MSYLHSGKAFDQGGNETASLGWSHSSIRLPYAAVAARIFGGDTTVTSIEGYGTDRQIYIPMGKDLKNCLI
jgi:pyruvate dehydrogenase kinase 2/3/4